MRIAHFADSHLGHPTIGIQRHVADPWRPGVMLRQREVDLLTAFERTITETVACSPQLVLHAGDLFDSARPSAHILGFAMTQLRRLTDAGIELVMIEGNNSFPRDLALGHAHEVLAHLPNVHVVFDGAVSLRFGDVELEAYPHRATAKGEWPAPGMATREGVRILIAHGIADGHPFFRGDRPAAILDVRGVAEQFDYVALGHHHRFAQVPETGTAFYCGPSAMVGWSDFRPGEAFGFCLLDTESGLVEHRHVETRPMRAYGLDNAAGLGRDDVLKLLEQQLQELPPFDANCEVVIRNLDALVRRELSVREVEGLFGGCSALAISLLVREQRWEDVRSALAAGGGLGDRFRALVAQTEAEDKLKEQVELDGLELLELASEMVSDEEVGEVAE